MAASRLEVGVRDDLAEDLGEVEALEPAIAGASLEARQREDLRDERVEALDLALRFRTRAPARELEGDPEARERRAELVRDVAEEPSLGVDEGFDAVGHDVEIVGEVGQLIASAAEP